MPENYILLERIELNASVSSIALNNIPQTGYTDLKIVCSTRTDYAGFLDLNMFLNGNASSGYSWRRLNGDGGSATSTNSTSAGVIPSPTLGTTATANTFASTEIYIPNYTSTTSKSVSIDGVTENNATTSYQSFTAGLSTLSTAITSVNFGLGAGNFVAGSTFSLYGIAAVGTTPTIAPKASGGNIIDYDGTYWIHTFLTSGTFTPQTGLTCDYLVVAGGGGGGARRSGGGGAGGYQTSTLSVTATTYNVTVGAGGAGGANAGGGVAFQGTTGSNSIFSSITSDGGGGGASQNSGLTNGINGGSGGGASRAGTVGTGVSGQGNAGGTGQNGANPDNGGGGGGGSGGAGGNMAVGPTGGTGGAGSSSSITGSAVTRAWGGVGGGFTNMGTAASGSQGNAAGASAAANSGGGGNGTVEDSLAGGSGGSGIVIIRYPAA
jgi:hypothetical protein